MHAKETSPTVVPPFEPSSGARERALERTHGGHPMRQSLTSSTPLLLALTLLAGTACHRHRSPDIVPVFHELESNDTPDRANHFGLLRRGDRLLIEGFIDDPVTDIDGFAFTAAHPLHVDFQLFTDAPGADLDVCLYDPAIDEVIACFATPNEPERGGVDVFEGGLDFHLTVESFVGASTYTLEIVVHPLFALSAEQEAALARAGLEGSSTGLQARDAASTRAEDEAPDAARRYKLREVADAGDAPDLELEELTRVIVDEETGATFTVQFRRLSAPRASAAAGAGPEAPDGELR